MNILLITHETRKSSVLPSYLSASGDAVVICADLPDALKHFRHTFYPLIILDLENRHQEYLEFIRHLKTLPKGPQCFVLIVVPFADQTALKTAFEAGADDCLLTPVNPDLVRMRIKNIERYIQRQMQYQHAQEEALQRSEQRFRIISDLVSDYAYVLRVEPDGKLIREWVTDAFKRISGYSPEEIDAIGGWVQVVHPEDRDIVRRHRQAFLSGRESITEYRICTRYGDIFWLCDYSRPEWDDTLGRVVRVFGATQDITRYKQVEETLQKAHDELEVRVKERTVELAKANRELQREIAERQQAEEVLKASEARYRELFDHMSSGVAVYEAVDGGEDFVFKDFNRGGESIDHLKKEDLIGRRVSEVFPGVKDFGLFEVFQQVWRTGLPEHHPITLYEDDRIAGWRENDVYKLPSGEIVAVYDDVTARRQMELALEKERALLAQKVREQTAELRVTNAELARASQLKDEFLASMSHELRTPLNTVLGMTEALAEEIYGAMNEKQRYALHMIEGSGRHLLSLINDILDLSKIEAGKMELHLSPVTVSALCQSSLQFIKQIAHKRHLHVLLEIDSAVGIMQADERRLKQILVNLLSNAVKFTPEGGNVGLEVKRDTECRVIYFTVWDTGIGIAAEEMHKLFQPFVQLDASLARKYEGAGLGLSLVYRMVEMHGGSISVESQVSQGSRFTIALPWKEPENHIRTIEESLASLSDFGDNSLPCQTHPSGLRDLRVLLADDNEDTIHTLSTYLTAKGYQVLIARDGKEAVTLTKEDRPDLILMDVQMPEMNGLEAIRHIKKTDETKEISIVVLTALAMPGDRERCLAAGADEYMSKPVRLCELDAMLYRLGKRALSRTKPAT